MKPSARSYTNRPAVNNPTILNLNFSSFFSSYFESYSIFSDEISKSWTKYSCICEKLENFIYKKADFCVSFQTRWDLIKAPRPAGRPISASDDSHSGSSGLQSNARFFTHHSLRRLRSVKTLREERYRQKDDENKLQLFLDSFCVQTFTYRSVWRLQKI